MDILGQTKQKMVGAIEHLKNELKSLRTGRANPAILDGVHVEIYGSMMRLKDLSTISSPESRQLLISPFDPQNAGAIAKAIEKSNLGLMPVVEGHAIRIKIPPMDESVRKEMVKQCHKKREDCKVSIRNERRHSNDTARKQKTEGLLAEDLLKKLEKEIQELTDKFCREADELSEKKEKEITTI